MSLVDLVQLQSDLIRDEGLRLEAYKDSLGFWTQGVGHLKTTPPPHPSWTREYCLQVLNEDIQVAVAGAEKLPCWASLDTEPRRRALVNMRFQLGHRLETFIKSLRFLSECKFREAGEELRRSTWYIQTPIRAERVIRMIEVG